MKCKVCKKTAVIALESHNAAFCGECYGQFFRRQLQRGIETQNLLKPEDKILTAVSGGKDSLVLLLGLLELGYNVSALFIDLGIPDSSDAARKIVEEFCALHNVPLRIFELSSEGFTIPEVKEKLKRPVCAVCGKIKRHYFNRLAVEGGYDVLATGHNLDDETGRLISNVLRWDGNYLASQGPYLPAAQGFAAKVKPLWRLTEFETANYAWLRKIRYHCATCPYSAGASFSLLKGWMQTLEQKMPGRKLDFYQGFINRGRQGFAPGEMGREQKINFCSQCGAVTAAEELCAVCRLKTLLEKDGNS